MYCKINDGSKIYMVENIENDIVKARCGNTVIFTNINHVNFIDEIVSDKKTKRYNIELNNEKVQNEIMLRHLTKNVAVDMLDKYIDQAVVARLPLIKVIHGKHGGIIRSAVHEYLDTSPFVESYRLGHLHEGGIGVTIVKVKLVIK